MNKDKLNSENFIYQKVGKESGFTVSLNYFEEIENDFSIRLFQDENIKKKSFEIPSDYFDNLEEKITRKIELKQRKEKLISFKKLALKIIPISAAASIILFIGVNSFNYNKTNLIDFSSITNNEIENWLMNNSNSINDEDINSLIYYDNSLDDDLEFTYIDNLKIENYIYTDYDLIIINELY